MRSDMAKVIVERPRLGSRASGKPKGYRRSLQRLSVDGLPVREGIKARCRSNRKCLNEHLGPLRRYLNSHVGRPWDAVFSEICAHINRNSAVQDHVRDHVEQYVARNVILIDGVPCDGEGGRSYGQPLHTWRYRPWYVCPRTGLLKRVPPPRMRPRIKSRVQVPNYIKVSSTLVCKHLDGAWYVVTTKPLPLLRDRHQEWDIVLGRSVADLTPVTARKQYGSLVYAISKRRLSRKELAQYPIPMQMW